MYFHRTSFVNKILSVSVAKKFQTSLEIRDERKIFLFSSLQRLPDSFLQGTTTGLLLWSIYYKFDILARML